jgi:archaellum component FlaC
LTWLKSNLATLITLMVLVIGTAVAYGRMSEICSRVESKADREAITREIDQINNRLERIENKVDRLLGTK